MALTSPQSAMERPSPDQQSLFLRLPAELRNTIYELVAGPQCTKSGDKTILFEHTAAVNLYVSVARVDRQCRDEYLPIFYDQVARTNSVQAKVHDLVFDDLSRFLDILPSQRGVRKVVVTLLFGDSRLTVDMESITRWAKATAHRRAGWTEVAYKAAVDWTRISEEKFNRIDDAIDVVAETTVDGDVREEIAAICAETCDAAYWRRVRQRGSFWAAESESESV